MGGGDNHNITPEQVGYFEAIARLAKASLNGQDTFALQQDVNTRASQLQGAEESPELSKENKEKQHAQLAAIVGVQIAEDHANFMANGFNSKQDFYRYGDMLNNDDYWNYLQENPEEKKKIADRMVDDAVQAVQEGTMTPDDIEDLRKNPRTNEMFKMGGIDAALRDIGTEKSTGRSNSHVAGMTAGLEGMASQKSLDDSAKKAAVEAELIAKGEISSATEKQLTERDAAKLEVREEVIAKAKELGADSKYKEKEGTDHLAFFGTPEGQDTIAALKKAQDDTQDKPSLEPKSIDIADNSKAAEKSANGPSSLV